jgi:IS1 family transposase
VIRYGRQKNGEQEYKCKRCGKRFNRRKGTPLEGLRTPIYVIVMAIAMYMCGVGVAMIADVTGKQEKTVERWIRRIAPHCEGLIKQELSKQNHGFTSVYLQMDEFWSYLWRKKTKVWIWTGIDVVTRLFIAFHIGDRSGDSAKALIETIKTRIHGVPGLITTDGLEAYVEKIKRYFKGSMYAQVVKEWEGGRIARVYKMVISSHSLEQVVEFISRLKNVGKTVNTSYVERFNLTLRNCLCSLVRRTLAAAKLKGELEGQMFLFQVYYNFIRPHMSLTVGKGRGKEKRTPAIAAGLTDHIWNWEDVLLYHPTYPR